MEMILASVFVLAAFMGGMMFERKTGNHETLETPIKKKKAYKPKYNSGNLLDPISPAEQRLEKVLNQIKDHDKEVDYGDEEG